MGPKQAQSGVPETGANDGLNPARPGMTGLSGAAAREETDNRDCVAASKGLEPPTLALGKPCSIRLSYEATLAKSMT